MKPIEMFLATLHPEVVERGNVLLCGEDIEFGKADNKALKKLVKEHHATGQEALEGFIKWMVRSESMKPKTARLVAATTWNALCMTYDVSTKTATPLKLLDRQDETYSYGTKTRIAVALRLWARYKQDTQLYEQITMWMRRKPDVTPQYILDEINAHPPHTRAEYRRLLKALEEFRGAPRYPWAWPCLRMVFIAGANLGEVVLIEKVRIKEALDSGSMTLRLRGGRQRVIPTAMVREPLEALLAFQWDWGIVGELVCPSASGQMDASATPLTRVAKLVYKRAKVPMARTWSYRLRWSAAWQYYEVTDSLVGASQILGIKDLAQVRLFLTELKRRRDAAVAEAVALSSPTVATEIEEEEEDE